MSLTATGLRSKLCIDEDLLSGVRGERLCKLSTLFDGHCNGLSNIMSFCLTGMKFENSIAGNLRDCTHSWIKSGKFEILFLYTREPNDGITTLLLTSCISKLVFLCLDADFVSKLVDECRLHGVRSVTIPSISRYLTSSSGVWLRSCPAMVVVQWWKSVSVST